MASKALHSVLFVLALSLAGCASTRDKNPPADTQQGSPSLGSQSDTSTDAVQLTSDRGLPAGVRSATIYFAFDSDAISAEGRQIVESWARWLSANSGAKLRLEGHADERGTPEYNQGLGERRAIAVRRALVNLGVSAGQLEVVSYGETRPAVQGSSEDVWSKNRRVEIVR